MKLSLRNLLFVTLVIAATLFATTRYFGSERRQIQQQLEGLAQSLAFEHGPPQPQKAAQALSATLSSPVTVETSEVGESTIEHGDLLQGFLAYFGTMQKLSLTVEHVQIELSEDDTRAVARFELRIATESHSSIANKEDRKAVCTFEKRDGRYVITHVKLSEPRIDQPEARP